MNFPNVNFVQINFAAWCFGWLLCGTMAFQAIGQEEGITEIVTRIWTKRNGDQVSGTFRARTESSVKIEKYDGGLASLEFGELIAEDQDYVREVVRKFGSAPGARTFRDTTGTQFRGTYVGLSGSEVVLLLFDNNQRTSVETVFLSPADQEFLLERLNRSRAGNRRRNIRYRVWRYQDRNQNQLECLGQYARVAGERVYLNQDGESHSIPLDSLSDDDLGYIIGLDPTAASAVNRYRGENLRSSGGPKRPQKKQGEEIAAAPEITPIWWISLGVVVLLLLALITIKYIYESSSPEWDDDDLP